MSRNPKIETILEVWFDADYCTPDQRANLRYKRDELIKKYVGDNPFTIEQVLDCLHSQYQDYRRDRIQK